MSTHKLTSKTKVPFPCWLHVIGGDWHWVSTTKLSSSDLRECDAFSDNAKDQPPLGEPAPECHDWPNAHGRVVDAAGNAITSDPTPSAPSLQSVAEGAAEDILNTFTAGYHGPDMNINDACKILTRHFAPLLTERDERIGRLEEAREDALQALGEHPESETDLAQRIRGIRQEGRDLFHDLTALRTRCEELQEDKKDFEHLLAHLDKNNVKYDRAAIRAARKEGQQAHEKGEGA